MDKVYKDDIPKYRKALEGLNAEFATIEPKTDWTKLRIEPLIKHVGALEQLLRSPKFAQEIKRLRKGVAMFHADLVYLRTNIKSLKAILAEAKANT